MWADQNAPKCAKVVQENMHVLDLADAWRTLNQEEQKYTWRGKNPEIHCRLDFFLVSQTILNKTMSYRYPTGI